jgi:hypothetical protein
LVHSGTHHNVDVLSGDGDGEGGPTSSPPPSTGNFVDSPVHGLQYSASPSGLSGVTSEDGEFQYRSGDKVTFTLGRVTIGTAPAQTQITPFLGASIPSVITDTPVNIAQLLLGLDTTPGSDRITLSSTPPNLPLATCIICQNFDDQIATAGIRLASEAEAIAHLKSQFAIWGSWATAVTPNHLQVITFMPHGIYMLANDDDPTSPEGNRWDRAANLSLGCLYKYTVLHRDVKHGRDRRTLEYKRKSVTST